MGNKMHLWVDDTVETDSSIVIGVTIERPKHEPVRLWYRVPVEYRPILTKCQDPFVLGSLFMAMRESMDIVVHGEVSPSLLRNLEEFQAVWTCWRPEQYTKIEIKADVEREQPRANAQDKALVAFSGGADSCFTVWRHHTGRCGRLKRNLQAGVMVHGFDIPLDRPDDFERAAARSMKILTSVGMELIPVVTNFRKVEPDWRWAHGAGLGSSLMLFQGGYSIALIGSSRPYQAIEFLGSNPVTDGMMSSDSFQIVHDGAAFIRHEKLGEIANWPEAMQNLRVCYAGEQKDRNCGNCYKCIRTILGFRAIGLGLPACFENDISDRQILSLKNLRSDRANYLNELLLVAKEASISESWVKALERSLHQNRPNAKGKLTPRQRFRKIVPYSIRKQLHRLVGRAMTT